MGHSGILAIGALGSGTRVRPARRCAARTRHGRRRAQWRVNVANVLRTAIRGEGRTRLQGACREQAALPSEGAILFALGQRPVQLGERLFSSEIAGDGKNTHGIAPEVVGRERNHPPAPTWRVDGEGSPGYGFPSYAPYVRISHRFLGQRGGAVTTTNCAAAINSCWNATQASSDENHLFLRRIIT